MKPTLRTALLTSVALFALAGLGVVAPQASQAMDSMHGSMMMADCKTSDSQMMKMAMPDSMMMKASGHTDKDFASAMSAHEHAMVAMAKVEVKCGKDAKAKAAAQKFLDDSSAFMDELNRLTLHTP